MQKLVNLARWWEVESRDTSLYFLYVKKCAFPSLAFCGKQCKVFENAASRCGKQIYECGNMALRRRTSSQLVNPTFGVNID